MTALVCTALLLKRLLPRSRAVKEEPPSKRSRFGEESVGGVTKLFSAPLIMTKVANSMRPPDILHLRSTCRLWNHAMTPELRRSHKSIYATISPELNLPDICPKAAVDVPWPFAKLFIAAGGVGSSEFPHPRRIFDHPHVQRLTAAWAPHLTTLRILLWFHGTGSGPSATQLPANGLRQLIFNLTPSLRNLQLETRNDHDLSWLADAGDPWTWQTLPHLKTLDLEMMDGAFMNQLVRDLLRAATTLQTLKVHADGMRVVQQEWQGAALEELTVTGSMDAEAMDNLMTLVGGGGLTVQRLSCTVLLTAQATPRPANRVLKEILDALSPHLRQLDLNVLERGYDWALELPVVVPDLPGLEWVSIGSDRIQLEGTLPRLKSLTLAGPPGPRLVTILRHSPITTLIINPKGRGAAVDSLEILRILTEGFPNVRSLDLGITLGCVPNLWTAWPDLEELELKIVAEEVEKEHVPDMDQLLTGFGAETCDELGKMGVTVLTKEKEAAGLVDLKQLRCFNLFPTSGPSHALDRYWRNDDWMTLTDISGYHAFAPPGTRLQQIIVKGGAAGRISANCRAAIRQRLGLGAVILFDH